MRVIVLLAVVLLLTSCIFRKRSNYVHDGGGVFIQTIDSNLQRQVQIVHFNSNIGVIFPAEYGREIYRGADSNKVFFTPDTLLIKKVNMEIGLQYCEALKRQWKQYTLVANKYCELWQRDSAFYDRQFIAYKSLAGDEIIKIKLIDFREDPHQLRPYFKTSWIAGWHGWFGSNTKELTFNISKNILVTE